jgi:hypothetical protein
VKLENAHSFIRERALRDLVDDLDEVGRFLGIMQEQFKHWAILARVKSEFPPDQIEFVTETVRRAIGTLDEMFLGADEFGFAADTLGHAIETIDEMRLRSEP